MASGSERTRAGALRRKTPVVLSIAGSDSGGGAGVQADLKAFARCHVHGACALTAVTAQSTVGTDAVHWLPPAIVVAQIRAVVQDMGVDAVKVGMLGSAEVAEAVAAELATIGRATPIVVDPVMRATTGARLTDDAAVRSLAERIVPLASVITPNEPEARRLLAAAGAHRAQPAPRRGAGAGPRELLAGLLALGPQAVVLTGGHTATVGGDLVDLFGAASNPRRIVEIHGRRHAGAASHGSGCTHAAVLAAELARGRAPLAAARRARKLTAAAIARGLADVGAGNGPVDVLGLGR